MSLKIVSFILFVFIFLKQSDLTHSGTIVSQTECPKVTVDVLSALARVIAPEMKGKVKGEVGTILVVGGSPEFAAGPYFAAMSALKSGADIVNIITTEAAAPFIRIHSPDFAVFPHLNFNDFPKINTLLQKMDVVLIGPGLALDNEVMKTVEEIIKVCRAAAKPLIIDANALFIVSKNPALVRDYPKPGVILTPNKLEAGVLQTAMKNNSWGETVSIFYKGQEDRFYSNSSAYNWSLSEGGSGRRTVCQGDILSGSLATIYAWALKYKDYRECYDHDRIAQSLATYASARLTRLCNSRAFEAYGRSFVVSNMLEQVHKVHKEIF